jgi:hypothetical protein
MNGLNRGSDPAASQENRGCKGEIGLNVENIGFLFLQPLSDCVENGVIGKSMMRDAPADRPLSSRGKDLRLRIGFHSLLTSIRE